MGLVVACSNSNSDNSDSSNGGGGGSGGKASGGSGGKSSGGNGGKASGGSGGSGGSGSGGSGSGGSSSGGSGSGGSGSGGSGSGGSALGSGGAPAGNNGDTAEWNFEQQTQLWKALRGTEAVKVSTTTVLKGKQSLEFPIVVTAADVTAAGVGKSVERGVGLSNPGFIAVNGVPSWSNKTVVFHVWVPTDFPDGYFTAFINGMGQAAWKDSGFTGLNKGGWTDISLAMPAVSNAGQLNFLEMGLYFNGFSAPWTGSIFIDSVEIK